MKIICLTGGLASGKSTAVRYLADKGAHIIDADVLGHRAYDPGTRTFDQVIETFGPEVRSDAGEIDRKVLGSKVFGNPAALKKLTDIVWPEIRRLAESEIAAIGKADADAVVVLEAAVLFEAGWEDMGDAVWVITVNRETAISRSMARDGAPREAVENRLNAQLSNDERASRADTVIANDGDQAALYAQLDSAWAAATGAG